MAETSARPLHVEVAVHAFCPTPLATLRSQWHEFLQGKNQPRSLLLDGRQVDLSVLPEELRTSCWRAWIIFLILFMSVSSNIRASAYNNR